jgi:hypothetical protein
MLEVLSSAEPNLTNMWLYHGLEQQERAAVETIQQWQMKGFEINQGTENIPQNIAQNSTVRSQDLECRREAQVYAQMTSAVNKIKPVERMVPDVVANATAAAGIQVVYPTDVRNSGTEEKNDIPTSLKDEQIITSSAACYQPGSSSNLLPKLPEIGSLQWQQVTEKGVDAVSATLTNPIYTQLKSGSQIIEESDLTVAWPTTSTSGNTIPPNNHIIVHGFQGNIY